LHKPAYRFLLSRCPTIQALELYNISYSYDAAAVNAIKRHIASRRGQRGRATERDSTQIRIYRKNSRVTVRGFRAGALSRTRSRRLGEPKDIGAMVAHLMSDGGEWINGQTLSVDGGATLR
jgi:NAD(P)-dependent dehydrogenase (short-subunit alcohol dehydrogenase family)